MTRDTIQTTQNRKVRKLPEYLSAQEVTQLLNAASKTRYSLRDQALILLTFRHGFRASEVVALEWRQIDLKAATILVDRLKGSNGSVQTLEADEARLLARLKKESDDSAWVFLSERKDGPIKADTFLKLMARLGKQAGFAKKLHPHMLRHGCGYELVNSGASTRQIQAYLGHRNLANVEIYTQLNANAFRGFGKRIGGRVK